jgi:hypothetical protein
MHKRKLKPLSPREIERRQCQRFETVVVAGPWGDVREAMLQSGLGRSTICELVRQQMIRSSKVGRRRLVNLPSLISYIEARAVGPAAPTKESEQLPATE